MFTTVFWKDAAERAIATGAQTLVGLWTAAGVFNLLTVDWAAAGGVAAGAAALSLLKSLVATTIAERGTASLVRQDRDPHTWP
ncbi:holin [Pseudonocardia sp. NPDC049635]|uniref:holin n=1 Tax=Pseudonocardia sp. NPDC049635 TaxID=3155506 RepID=UPI0033DCEA35